mgnify:CR=1 FL=1
MLQTPEDFAAIDDPSTSTSEVVAYRPEWRDEDLSAESQTLAAAESLSLPLSVIVQRR